MALATIRVSVKGVNQDTEKWRDNEPARGLGQQVRMIIK